MAVILDYVSDHVKPRSSFISCALIPIGQLGSGKSSSTPAGNHSHGQNPCTLTSSLNVLFTSCPVWPWYPQGNCFPFISRSWQPLFSYKPFLIRFRSEVQVFCAPCCFFWIIFFPFLLKNKHLWILCLQTLPSCCSYLPTPRVLPHNSPRF